MARRRGQRWLFACAAALSFGAGAPSCADEPAPESKGCGPCVAGPSSRAECQEGACVIVCDPGWDDCNKDPADGCEAGLSTSSEDCGACGVRCDDLPHVGAAECALGTCAVYGCAPGFGDCNSDPADGCEVDTSSTAGHCGGCGLDCAVGGMTHASDASCVAGECLFACDANFADCNEDPADGCEVDVRIDGAHCGACFHDCMLGGPCADARCQPVVVVADAGKPFDVAVEGGDLYWIDNDPTAGAVRRVSPFLNGAAPSDIESIVVNQLDPFGVVVDGPYIYWTTWGDDKIQRAFRDKSGVVESLAGPVHVDPLGLTVVSGAVYWADFDLQGTNFAAYRAFLPNGAPEVMQAPADRPTDVAVVGGVFYWASSLLGTIQSSALAPLSPPLATYQGTAPGFISADKEHIYFSEDKSIKRIALDLSPSTIEEIATVDRGAYGVAVDKLFVYFSSRDLMDPAPGTIYRVRKP